MLMEDDLISTLRDRCSSYPFMFARAATLEEIRAEEKRVGMMFPNQYCEFLKIWGGAMIGAYPIFGTDAVDLMDTRLNTVSSVTEFYREQGWRDVDSNLVVSQNHGGDPVLLTADGSLFVSSHDKIANTVSWSSFEDYIKWCLNR